MQVRAVAGCAACCRVRCRTARPAMTGGAS